MKRKAAFLAVLLALAAMVSACSDDESSKSKSVRDAETDAINTAFDRLVKSQQVPAFDFSQERQTLIDILTIRAHGTHGTAVATTMNGDLLWWCPSVGGPIPSTYQLTNPNQVVGRGTEHHYEGQVLPLGEPSGDYTGDSAATWTKCLDDNGKPFAKYEEQPVGWTSGIVNSLPRDKRARVDEITFAFPSPPPKKP